MKVLADACRDGGGRRSPTERVGRARDRSRIGRDADTELRRWRHARAAAVAGWTWDHFEFSTAYGFYAAIGNTHKERTLPLIGTVTTEDPDNIGYGLDPSGPGAAAFYPSTQGHRAVAAITYEHHDDKETSTSSRRRDHANWGSASKSR